MVDFNRRTTLGRYDTSFLNEKGEWVSYSLRLDDEKDVNLFKQGIAPKKGFFSRILGL